LIDYENPTLFFNNPRRGRCRQDSEDTADDRDPFAKHTLEAHDILLSLPFDCRLSPLYRNGRRRRGNITSGNSNKRNQDNRKATQSGLSEINRPAVQMSIDNSWLHRVAA
jgi:hypothetical protein